MSYPVYQVPAGDVLPILFSTYDGGTGASLTMTGLAVTDIEIYKDGSVTQRASDAGYTLLDTDGIDFDALTGIHGFSIDTGDNTDAGFYTVGAWFHVVVSAITVDAQTVSFIAAAFRLMAAESVAGKPKVDVDAWLGTAAATPTVAGVPEVDVTHFNGTAGTFASGIPQVTLTTSSKEAVADQVWDEAASGHVASGSFGQRANIIRAGTAQAGDATHITLDASASAVTDFYKYQIIMITGGTGANQGNIISAYDGTTKIATVAASWGTNPDVTSVFVIMPFGSIPGATAPTAGEVADAVWDEAISGHLTAGSGGAMLNSRIIRYATAQAGGASSITLDASASATNDLYNYCIITIVSGTGAAQSRQISDYNGTSKVATVSLAWITQPSSDSVFAITPLGVDAATVAAIADGVWDEARSGHVAAGSFGEYVLADATRLSGDATAADNAESFFDGTGYAGTGNTIPTVTTVTNQVTANVTGISGDASAADNLEAALDGTGGVTISAALTGNITGNLSGSVGSVTGAVGSVTGAVGSVTGAVGSVTGAVGSVTGNVGGNVVGTVGSLAAQAKADVNAEVVDALATDTYAEPAQGTPAATATLAAKVNYLYKAWRNRSTQTATQYSLYADDATTVDQKAAVSDDATTFSRGEIATGP